MSKRNKVMLWFLFLGTLGFSFGGYFLLLFLVPFEECLVNIGKTQSFIDKMISYILILLLLFLLMISVTYYKKVLKPNRKLMSVLLTAFTSINAVIVIYFFLNTDTALISLSRGEVETASERFTFGPYPDQSTMQTIKEQGYEGIITLLNPTIVFEKKLLTDEQNKGEKLGIKVHSFPMLPWVGDNKQSIEGILNLVDNNPGKRYYIHCYLGKHRVDYIKKILIKTKTVNAEKQDFLLDDEFERGNVYSHQQDRIILGPFPIDEEWFDLLRKEVKEIITFMDPSSNLFLKEKKIAEENNIKLTAIEQFGPNDKQLTALINYLKDIEHRVYVHDFKSDKKILELDYMLRYGEGPVSYEAFPPQINNSFVNIGNRIFITKNNNSISQINILKQTGIKKVIVLDHIDDVQSNVRDDYLELLEYERFLLKDNSYQSLYNFANYLVKQGKPTVVVNNLGVDTTKRITSMVNRMMVGVPKEIDGRVLENGELTVIARKVIIGPPLASDEWDENIFLQGIQHMIFIYAPSIQNEKQVQEHQRVAEDSQITFEKIDMFEDYNEVLLEKLSSSDETVYVVVAPQVKKLVITHLSN